MGDLEQLCLEFVVRGGKTVWEVLKVRESESKTGLVGQEVRD